MQKELSFLILKLVSSVARECNFSFPGGHVVDVGVEAAAASVGGVSVDYGSPSAVGRAMGVLLQ